MKKLLAILLASGSLYAADDVVFPTRLADVGIPYGYSLPYATWTNTTTWLTGNGTATNLYDFSPSKANASFVRSHCITLVAGSDYLQFASAIPVGATATWEGTAGLSIIPTTTNRVICTTNGTVWNLKIYDGTNLWANIPCGAGSGNQLYGIVNGRTPTIVTASGLVAVWGNTQNVFHDFANRGGSKTVGFDASAGCYAEYDLGTSGSGYFGACTISMDVKINDLDGIQVLWAHGNGAYRCYINESNVCINTTLTDYYFPDSGTYTIAVDYNSSGDGTSLRVDGTTVWTSNAPAASAGATVFNLAARNHGLLANIVVSSFSITGTNGDVWEASDSYGTNLLSASGTRDMSLNGSADFVYIPALTSGTNDVAGFELTNPKGAVHNNGPYSLAFGGVTNTYSMMLTNAVSITTNATGQIRSYAK